jgi:hypothetical protein
MCWEGGDQGEKGTGNRKGGNSIQCSAVGWCLVCDVFNVVRVLAQRAAAWHVHAAERCSVACNTCRAICIAEKMWFRCSKNSISAMHKY